MMESRAPEERPTTAEATGSSDALPASVREAYAALPAPRYVAVWILVVGFRKGAFAMHEVECGSDACYCCSRPRYRLTSVMEDKKACVLVPQLVPRYGLTAYLRHPAPSHLTRSMWNAMLRSLCETMLSLPTTLEPLRFATTRITTTRPSRWLSLHGSLTGMSVRGVAARGRHNLLLIGTCVCS